MSSLAIVSRRPFEAYIWPRFVAEMRSCGVQEGEWTGDAISLEVERWVVLQRFVRGMKGLGSLCAAHRCTHGVLLDVSKADLVNCRATSCIVLGQ